MDTTDKKLPAIAHLPWGEVPIDEGVKEVHFPRGSTTANCRGACCRRSVLADPTERDRILEHAQKITPHLEPDQIHDTDRWFERRAVRDSDFPSGEAYSTGRGPHGCVFLNRRGRCALQITEQRSGISNLKPFYCRLYPLTVEKGCLIFDERPELKTSGCCVPAEGGPRDIFEVCRTELDLVRPKTSESSSKG